MLKETEIKRKTRETEVFVWLAAPAEQKLPKKTDIDKDLQINTGIGFLDHMLHTLAVHSGFALRVVCRGDLNVDCHHTVEDVGIALGQAFAALLEDKSGLARYGSQLLPMDEALAHCALDLSGRPVLVFRADLGTGKVGELELETVREFFYAFAMNAGITLHLELLYGENRHHMTETLFKAFAHALRKAAAPAGNGVLSAKGSLA
jgi:imidazoleglycerol-phosphate dehydratase